MIRAVVAIAWLTACGGKAPAPKPAPAPSESERTLVATAETVQAEVCACKDAACLDTTIADRWDPTFNTPPTETAISDAGAARFARAYLAVQRCIQLIYDQEDADGTAAAALDGMRALADRACACADRACLEDVARAWEELSVTHASTRATDADVERFTVEYNRMYECATRVAP